MHEPLQTPRVAADPLGGLPVSADLSERLRRRRGGGRRLPSTLVKDMEQRLNADFSQVRVHDDPEAHTIAEQVQSTAFTLGTDIYFSPGALAIASASGKRLIAHELSHVAQSTRLGDGTSSRRIMVGRADDPIERAADLMATAALTHQRTEPVADLSADNEPDGVWTTRGSGKHLKHTPCSSPST